MKINFKVVSIKRLFIAVTILMSFYALFNVSYHLIAGTEEAAAETGGTLSEEDEKNRIVANEALFKSGIVLTPEHVIQMHVASGKLIGQIWHNGKIIHEIAVHNGKVVDFVKPEGQWRHHGTFRAENGKLVSVKPSTGLSEEGSYKFSSAKFEHESVLKEHKNGHEIGKRLANGDTAVVIGNVNTTEEGKQAIEAKIEYLDANGKPETSDNPILHPDWKGPNLTASTNEVIKEAFRDELKDKVKRIVGLDETPLTVKGAKEIIRLAALEEKHIGFTHSTAREAHTSAEKFIATTVANPANAEAVIYATVLNSELELKKWFDFEATMRKLPPINNAEDMKSLLNTVKEVTTGFSSDILAGNLLKSMTDAESSTTFINTASDLQMDISLFTIDVKRKALQFANPTEAGNYLKAATNMLRKHDTATGEYDLSRLAADMMKDGRTIPIAKRLEYVVTIANVAREIDLLPINGYDIKTAIKDLPVIDSKDVEDLLRAVNRANKPATKELLNTMLGKGNKGDITFIDDILKVTHDLGIEVNDRDLPDFFMAEKRRRTEEARRIQARAKGFSDDMTLEVHKKAEEARVEADKAAAKTAKRTSDAANAEKKEETKQSGALIPYTGKLTEAEVEAAGKAEIKTNEEIKTKRKAVLEAKKEEVEKRREEQRKQEKAEATIADRLKEEIKRLFTSDKTLKKAGEATEGHRAREVKNLEDEINKLTDQLRAQEKTGMSSTNRPQLDKRLSDLYDQLSSQTSSVEVNKLRTKANAELEAARQEGTTRRAEEIRKEAERKEAERKEAERKEAERKDRAEKGFAEDVTNPVKEAGDKRKEFNKAIDAILASPGGSPGSNLEKQLNTIDAFYGAGTPEARAFRAETLDKLKTNLNNIMSKPGPAGQKRVKEIRNMYDKIGGNRMDLINHIVGTVQTHLSQIEAASKSGNSNRIDQAIKIRDDLLPMLRELKSTRTNDLANLLSRIDLTPTSGPTPKPTRKPTPKPTLAKTPTPSPTSSPTPRPTPGKQGSTIKSVPVQKQAQIPAPVLTQKSFVDRVKEIFLGTKKVDSKPKPESKATSGSGVRRKVTKDKAQTESAE